MLKRIKLLGTLLIIALVLGGISMCSTREIGHAFEEGIKDGTEEGYARYGNTFGEEHSLAYEKGRQVGVAARQKVDSWTTLHLIPKDYMAYPDTVINARTGMPMPVSMRTARVRLGTTAQPLKWLRSTLIVLYALTIIAFIILLIWFISTLKTGEIFNKENERKLRWMGILFLISYAVGWAIEGIDYAFIKSIVTFENYSVAMDRMSAAPLIAGIIFLLFAQIFALGRNMKEDQEFMV